METIMKQSASETRDGFQLNRDQFTLPKETSALDPKTKRAVTICNLFLNHKLGLSDIVRLLDEDNGRVVLALLEREIIQDRRVKAGAPPDGKERRKVRT
jgi:hypothetical protein